MKAPGGRQHRQRLALKAVLARELDISAALTSVIIAVRQNALNLRRDAPPAGQEVNVAAPVRRYPGGKLTLVKLTRLPVSSIRPVETPANGPDRV